MKLIRYNGSIYRQARTREDVRWSQIAETAKRLTELAENDYDAVTKRELAREIWSELREQIAEIGFW